MLQQERAQDSVHKSRRGVAPKSLRQFDRLVDRDLDRHVVRVLEFVERDAQNVAVDNRELIDGIFWRMQPDDFVQFRAVLGHAVHQRVRELCPFSRQVLAQDQLVENLVRLVTHAVDLKEGL